MAGHPDYASSHHAKLLWDGLKEIRTEHILNPDRQPITFNILKSLIDNVELVTHSNYHTVVLKAVFTVLYSIMLRPGEVLVYRNSLKEVPTQILQENLIWQDDQVTLILQGAKMAAPLELHKVKLLSHLNPGYCPMTCLKAHIEL